MQELFTIADLGNAAPLGVGSRVKAPDDRPGVIVGGDPAGASFGLLWYVKTGHRYGVVFASRLVAQS